MPENTLLGLVGNLLGFDMPKSTTSADLPPLREMAHSYIDQIKESYDQQQQRDVQIQGQGLGLLDMVGGMAKAGALIPAFTKQYVKSKSGQSQIADMLKKISKERTLLSPGKMTPTEITNRMLSSNPSIGVKNINPGRMTPTEITNRLASERMMSQIFEKALEQYKQFGAARPGTEDFIQKLIKQLGK